MKIVLPTWSRVLAVLIKEFVQMRRDKATFALMIGVPMMQLLLFGYAINTNPKHLPMVIETQDYSRFTRSIIQGFEHTDYFQVVKKVKNEHEGHYWIETGKAQFLLRFPADFTRDLIRGHKPQLLFEADASDPGAVGQAMTVAYQLMNSVLSNDLVGPLQKLKPTEPPISLVVHAKYNPDLVTRFNIVPGLMGVILTMTMVTITSLAITRERERGTMEALLSMPVTPLEMMLGKVIPYILVGYFQVAIVLTAARFLFDVPLIGSIILLMIMLLPFIAANLTVGLTFSTIAKNQLQAIQLAFFFFLPSLMLSGFMFPFRGMPEWAQCLGEIFPLTHFLRIVRGILLKGNGFQDFSTDVMAIMAFLTVAIIIGVFRFKRTLD